MSVIENFLERYAKEYDYYYELARQVATICEALLSRNGIRAIVTYRAKKPESLREKLQKRDDIKKYQSIEQIYRDIVDLAGVRIANYFPGDRVEIGKLIENEFITEKRKKFPNNDQKSFIQTAFKKRFAGYDAIHYRIRMRGERLEDGMKRYSQSQVEIQIASALMHAWAEVEHDLAYKPKIGCLSEDEFKILDELNGLVLSGEIALEKLQKAFKSRIISMEHFNNHYELAALIRERVYKNGNVYIMGRVDILLYYLKAVDMDHPSMLSAYLDKLADVAAADGDKVIVNALVDSMLADNPDSYTKYIDAKFEVNHNPYTKKDQQVKSPFNRKALDRFMKGFIRLDQLLVRTDKASEGIWSETAMKNELNYVYRIRNQVIHGNDVPEDDLLDNAAKTAERIHNELKKRF